MKASARTSAVRIPRVTPVPPEIIAGAARPTIRLSGPINDDTVAAFHDQLARALETDAPIVLALYTEGGDAEIGRYLAGELRTLRERHDHDLWFIGKTRVASAGITVMSAFPVARLWLARDASLLIHGRRMQQDLRLDGPLAGCRRILEEQIANIDNGLLLEDQGFRDLIEGSAVDFATLRDKAYRGWHVMADEAYELGLVGGVF